jgi:hypothetical protein
MSRSGEMSRVGAAGQESGTSRTISVAIRRATMPEVGTLTGKLAALGAGKTSLCLSGTRQPKEEPSWETLLAGQILTGRTGRVW